MVPLVGQRDRPFEIRQARNGRHKQEATRAQDSGQLSGGSLALGVVHEVIEGAEAERGVETARLPAREIARIGLDDLHDGSAARGHLVTGDREEVRRDVGQRHLVSTLGAYATTTRPRDPVTRVWYG